MTRIAKCYWSRNINLRWAEAVTCMEGTRNSIEFWYRESSGRQSDGFLGDNLPRCEVCATGLKSNPVAAFCITAMSISRVLLQGA